MKEYFVRKLYGIALVIRVVITTFVRNIFPFTLHLSRHFAWKIETRRPVRCYTGTMYYLRITCSYIWRIWSVRYRNSSVCFFYEIGIGCTVAERKSARENIPTKMDNAEVRKTKQLPSRNKFRKRRMFLHPSSLVRVTRECSRSNLQNLPFNYFTICFVSSLAANEESTREITLEYSVSRDTLEFVSVRVRHSSRSSLQSTRRESGHESGPFDGRGERGEAARRRRSARYLRWSTFWKNVAALRYRQHAAQYQHSFP